MLETSARLLALLSLLQARRDWPGPVLAERLEVSARTVRRDVDRLRELGYPVQATKGPDGGYRLAPGADLPPLLFDDEQAVAVAVALQTATSSVAGIEEAALRALATVRQVMPARLRHRVDALQVTAVPRGPGGSRGRVDSQHLIAVGSAVRAREVLRFDYATARSGDAAAEPGDTTSGSGDTAADSGDATTADSGDPAAGSGDPAAGSGDSTAVSEDAMSPRRVEPHHVVTWGGRWYLVAWDLDRGDWRTFRVDRMTPRTPTGPRFTPRELPAPDVATYVSTAFRSGGWPCRGEVVLHARAADVSRWAGSQAVVEELGPDRCRVVTGSWSWESLAAWVGVFDVDLEVVGPPELHAAAARLAQRYARAAG